MKQLTHIDCPAEWQSTNDWDSHRPLLWLAVNNMDKGKSVTEFGCGEGSTLLLREYCEANNIQFNSYETNKEYAEKYGATKVNDYDEIQLSNIGLLFIDSAPGEQRKNLVEKHQNNADIIILHDTEVGARGIYGISEILNSFLYRLDYCPIGNPATSLLSNKINVSEWNNG